MIYKDWDIVLTGEHIRITPMTEMDEEPYSRLLLGKMYDRFKRLLGITPPSNLTGTLNHTSNDETHAIRLLGDDSFIGWIALQKNEEGQPDIGIALIEEQQNKGYGPEAVMLLANRLHNVYGLMEISVRISDKNVQSQRAFAKVGAVFEKALPDERFGALAKIYEETSGNLQLPNDGEIPALYHYHIPLPIEGYCQIPELTKISGEDQTGWTQGDEMSMIMRNAALDELLKLEKTIEERGGVDADKLKEYIRDRMNQLKNG